MATPHDHLDKLLETARAGQLDEFRLLVQETMCLNEIHPVLHEPIVATLASEGRDEIVRYLIEQGARLDFAGYGAARGGHHTLMNELLNQGASKNTTVRGAACGGHTVLMWGLVDTGASINSAVMGAGENGDSSLIQSLIEKGAHKHFALVGAIQSGDPERVRSMLSYSQDSGLIESAANYGHLILFEELKVHCESHHPHEKLPFNLAEGGHETPFLQLYGEQSEDLAWGICGAAQGGHVNFVYRLIEHAIQFALLNEKTALKFAVYGAATCHHVKLVDHLISRGATLEDALLGAAIGENTALMDKLIAQGQASGQLRKDTAVHAAAIAKRGDLMNAWLADGANLNQALRGVCTRGDNVELAKRLIAQGASLDFLVMGYFEGTASGLFRGDCEDFLQLLPRPHRPYIIFGVKALVSKGFYGSIHKNLAKSPPDLDGRQMILNAAVYGAACGGFPTMVTSLLEMGAMKKSAIEGAVEGSDRALIEALILHNMSYDPKLFKAFFKTAVATDQADLVAWMMNRLVPYDAYYHYTHYMKSLDTEIERVHALSMIENSFQQIEIARAVQSVHLIPTAQIVRHAKVSPQIASAAVNLNRESLQCVLRLCRQQSPGMAKDVKFKLFSFIAASEGYQIPERDIPHFMRAVNVAKTLKKFNEISDDEATELAAIRTRLNKFQKEITEEDRKSTQLAKATLLSDRVHVLSLHRHSFLSPRPLLARSLQKMMHRFDKYQSLSALKIWITKCESRLMTGRHLRLNTSMHLRTIREKLDKQAEFTEETSDPKVLAGYLLTEHEGKSLYRMLSTTRYWKDCVKHFPNMVKVLEESTMQTEARASRGCGF